MSGEPEQPFSVRAISERIGTIIDGLSEVWIEGELSEINVRPGSPTIFMRLRDTSADMSISVRCFKNVFDSVAPLEQNARVVIRSKPTWWTKNGSLSFNISEMRQVGVGELMARLEALKNLLAAEGLFDLERKKDERFIRIWEFYLAYCEAAFAMGNIDVVQYTLQKE